jgi:mono/diheme cytochrome c family protein
MRYLIASAFLAFALLSGLTAREAAPAPPAPVDFNRDVRPILSEHCFACHGPDEKQRKAKLRLDTREGLTGELRDGGHAVVAGKPEMSALVERITTDLDARRMPPAKTGKQLTAQQIATLKRWVEQGATWSAHWAFVPPTRPALPALTQPGSPVRNAIDAFIFARLKQEGLSPVPEADRVTLIRRLTFDLTGLPPTPAEVDAFLADTSPGAYEKLVDRLLANPHFGERMAVDWLDAARFADTHGYHLDSGRDMTRWREWVIDAYNRNLPFDQFTVEQLAGDLLPGATLEQKVASGFNRNHMINFEGGAIPAEYLNAYIVDRVNTTSTVWLGLTLGCCQCHDHKYDPFTQRDFYSLYAFFHQVPENGLDGSKGNAAPTLKAPTHAQQEQMDRLTARIKELEQRLQQPVVLDEKAFAEWQKTAASAPGVKWDVLEPQKMESRGGATLTRQADGAITATGTNPERDIYEISAPVKGSVTGVRLEALPDDRLKRKGPGRSDNGNIVLTECRLKASGKALKIKTASADFSQEGYPIAHAIGNASTGWAIFPEVGKPHTAVFELEQPLAAEKENTLTVVLEFQSDFAQHQLGRFRLAVTTDRDPNGAHRLPDAVVRILGIEAARRTPEQAKELEHWYQANVAPQAREVRDELARMKAELASVEKQVPTTMVMQDMPQMRDTFLLVRGQYDQKGQKVAAGVPGALNPLPRDVPANRLGLARWIVDPANPLTARVTVNRLWQAFFGLGLVRTAEDFGVQGERPSHPELLDWLAFEYQNPSPGPLGTGATTRWDTKALVRLIVTSATYRQSSKVSAALHHRDPENHLLARGPRFRLQAEFIRDQALAVSGLLDLRIGGASVFPYQPKGLWSELTSRGDSSNWSAQFYVQSKGHDLYRRTMYTFWKRTSPPPTLTTFDAPDRETCTVRRARTNTPLQALILMNDPTYVEASRVFAERILREGGQTVEERITFAFRMATARKPSETELTVLKRLYEKQLAVYRKDNAAALKLLNVGESPRDQKLDTAELAAWAMVASTILNLDETLTRG